MAHLLLSIAFAALLFVGFRSIWHDLTRPLVMQPWPDEAAALAPAADRAAPVAKPVVLRPAPAVSAGRPAAYGLALAA